MASGDPLYHRKKVFTARPYRPSFSPLSAGSANDAGNDSQPRRKRENLPKRAIEKLLEWLNQHWGHPYPSEQEKQVLHHYFSVAPDSYIRPWRMQLA
eukprot:749876-Hanusia_phi.AAC.3